MIKVHTRKAFLNIAIIIRSISTCVRKISLVRFMNLLSSPMFISRFYPSISENDIEYVRYNNMYFAFLSCFVIECRLCIILLSSLHVMFCSMLIGNEGKFRSFEKKRIWHSRNTLSHLKCST